jgi:uncharacterized SAM-dependent methyltransferase
MTFLLDLGVEPADGKLEFNVEARPKPFQLQRVAAWFEFTRKRNLRLDAKSFSFKARDRIRLFFSWRHTPEQVLRMLAAAGLHARGQWVTPSQEEGVFLAEREPGPKRGAGL